MTKIEMARYIAEMEILFHPDTGYSPTPEDILEECPDEDEIVTLYGLAHLFESNLTKEKIKC